VGTYQIEVKTAQGLVPLIRRAMSMSKTLNAHKRSRACKSDKVTGVRNCAATKLGDPACPACVCRGKEHALVIRPDIHHIFQQREILTRHLRAKSIKLSTRADVHASSRMGGPSYPRRCRKHCRAGLQCPAGQCFASFTTVTSQARLHEYAAIHGAQSGAGNYFELVAMEMSGEQPHPGHLYDRDEMAAELRSNLTPKCPHEIYRK
jgi:hypothetical protein